MIITSNSLENIKAIMLDDREFMENINSEMILSTQNREAFLSFSLGRKFFSATMSGVPNKSFQLGYLEQNFLSNEVMFLKFSNIITKGILFKYLEPWSFQNFFHVINEAKRNADAQERVKVQIDRQKEEFKNQKDRWKATKDKVKEAYNLRVEAWKEIKKEIKESNKILKDDWKAAYDSADEKVKQYIIEPTPVAFPDEPAKPEYADKPEEPNYLPLPKVRNIREERLDSTLSWKILRRFRYCKVKGSQWGVLIKRKNDLSFTFDNAVSLELEEINLEEFYTFIKENDTNLPSSDTIKQSFSDIEAIELMAEIDDTFEEMSFSEENIEEILLPPLAPIKAMHAASMLAGGIGEFYKEVKLDGFRIAIKAAIVKELHSRQTILNGKEVTETIETNNQKLGVYNLDTFKFKMLG